MATKRTLIILAIALALVGASCGGSGAQADIAEGVDPTSESAESTAAAQPSESQSPTPQTTTASETPIESDSPVENLLGIPIFDDAAMQKWFQNLSREAELVVATCMLGQGFEYTPTTINVSSADDELGTDSLEFAESRGFGIVSDFNESEYDPSNTTADKNAEYSATLTDGELDAYFIALSGSVDAEQQDIPFGQGGCRGEAEEEVFAVVGTLEAIGPVFDGYADLYFSDSRILETTKQWQACMAEDGYLFDDEEDAFTSVFVRFESIIAEPGAFNEVVEQVGAGDGHPGLVPAARAEMDALGEEEVMVAVANWTCREPIKDMELAVQREYESQFVAEVGPQVQELQSDG